MMDAQIALLFQMGKIGDGILTGAITGGKPDMFAGSVSIFPGQTYLDIANGFSKMEYPSDLSSFGFPTDLPALEASLYYKISSDWLRLAIAMEFHWAYPFGETAFTVERIRGIVEHDPNETRFALEGEFTLGGLEARMSLSLSSGDAPTLLEASVEEAGLTAVIDAVAGQGAYDDLPVPSVYQKPGSAYGAAMKLDLTAGFLELSGWLGQNAALFFRYNREESSFLVAAELRNFTFSDITPALEGLDAFLSLQSADAAGVLSSHAMTMDTVPGIGVIQAGSEAIRGLTFYLDARFDGLYLEKILKLPERCILYGAIPQDEKAELLLGGEISGITFLDFLELYAVRFQVRKCAEEFSFTISGGIRLFLGETLLDFQDTYLTVTQELVSLATNAELQIANPLGIPGITLVNLGFTARANFTESKLTSSVWYFEGEANFGSLGLYAQVLFLEQSPAVVRVEIGLEHPLRISDMIYSLLNITWPDILDIALYSGKIWYCTKTVQIDGVLYQYGLHAEVYTDLFFMKGLLLSADMSDGLLQAAAQVSEPIDFYFVKFSSAGGRGPKVGISMGGGQTRFALSADIRLLAYDVTSVEIFVGKSSMEGRLRFPISFPYLPQTVDFVWDSKGGVHLKESPLSGFGKKTIKIPKFTVRLGGCKALFKKLFKFKTKLKVKAAISTSSSDSAALLTVLFSVTIQLKTVATAFSGDTVDLTFSNLSLEIHPASNELTFKNMVETVADSAVASIGRLFGEIVSGQVFQPKEQGGVVDLEEVAKFLSIAGLQWGTREIVSFLVCRGMKKVLAEAFIGTVTAVVVTVFVYEGIKYLFGGMTGDTDGDGNYTPDGPGSNPNPDPENNPEVPDAPHLSFQGGIFYAVWESTARAERYHLELQKNDGTLLVTPTRSSTDYSATGTDNTPGGISFGQRYRARVVAMNSTGSSTGAENELYVLGRPVGLSLYFYCEGNRLAVSWSGDPESRTYTLALRSISGEQRELTGFTQSEAVVENLEWAGEVTAVVHGLAPDVEGPDSLPETLTLHHFAAPGIAGSFNYPEAVSLTWDAAGAAERFRVEVCDESGQPITVTAQFQDDTVLLTGDFIPWNRYTARMQAVADRVEGPWSQPHPFLREILGAPKSLKVTIGTEGIVSLSCTYNGQIYREVYFPGSSPIQMDGTGYGLELEDAEETARIRLRSANAAGDWCAPVSLLPVGRPDNFTASFANRVIHCAWTPVGKPAVYVLRVTGPEGEKLFEVSQNTYDIDAGTFPPGSRYMIFLHAEDPDDRRRRGESVCDYVWIL